MQRDIGTGTGALPVMDEVKREAARRKIKLLILPTLEAIEELKQHSRDTNAILPVTCLVEIRPKASNPGPTLPRQARCRDHFAPVSA